MTPLTLTPTPQGINVQLSVNHDYWQARIAAGNHFIADGELYCLGEEPSAADLAFERRYKRSTRGHSGRRFVIRFSDGEEVVTTNLQGSGRVPACYRDSFRAATILEGK